MWGTNALMGRALAITDDSPRPLFVRKLAAFLRPHAWPVVLLEPCQVDWHRFVAIMQAMNPTLVSTSEALRYLLPRARL